MKKILCFITAFTIISIMISGCGLKLFAKNHPTTQPNTKWISEDGKISFCVDENGKATGKLIIDEKTIDIYVSMGSDDTYIRIVHLESVIRHPDYLELTEVPFEFWVGHFYNKDFFTATVKRTTYFNVGDEITFYRVDDNVSTPDCAAPETKS